MLSHEPSAEDGALKILTVLLLGQTATWERSAFHAWHVILSSTRTAAMPVEGHHRWRV